MKILCETQVLNRHTQANKSVRAVKATLAVGFHNSSKDSSGNCTKELQIIHFTPQNKTGTRYKLRNNIEKMFTKFIQDGKATISFREPPENLMIKCDPIQLKGFLQTLKLGLEGKESLNLRLNIAGATAIPQKSQPQLKMNVMKRSDYPTKGFPRSLKSLTICNIKLSKVGFEMCSLRNLTSLNLSYNSVAELPVDLGRLSLTEFNICNNHLGDKNAWKWLQGKNLQKSLLNLDMSANQLQYFPPQLVKLEQLVTLKLNNNTIRSLPFGIRRMRNLRFLHLSSNMLESLPSAFNHTRLDVLDVWGNNFQVQIEHSLDSKTATQRSIPTGSPPLWLLAARAVNKHQLPYSTTTLPWVLVDVLSESPQCACGKLCYADSVLNRAAMATFVNVKDLIFSRDRLIYTDIVVCGPTCVGRMGRIAI